MGHSNGHDTDNNTMNASIHSLSLLPCCHVPSILINSEGKSLQRKFMKIISTIDLVNRDVVVWLKYFYPRNENCNSLQASSPVSCCDVASKCIISQDAQIELQG